MSSKDDNPSQRILRQKEIVDNLKRENDTLRLDLTFESRDAKKSSSVVATTDIARWCNLIGIQSIFASTFFEV